MPGIPREASSRNPAGYPRDRLTALCWICPESVRTRLSWAGLPTTAPVLWRGRHTHKREAGRRRFGVGHAGPRQERKCVHLAARDAELRSTVPLPLVFTVRRTRKSHADGLIICDGVCRSRTSCTARTFSLPATRKRSTPWSLRIRTPLWTRRAENRARSAASQFWFEEARRALARIPGLRGDGGSAQPVSRTSAGPEAHAGLPGRYQ